MSSLITTKPIGNAIALPEPESESPECEICRLHQENVDALQTGVARSIRIGEILTEKKEQLGHGEFLPWLNTTVPFNARTAQRYMKLFRSRHRLKNDNVSYLGQAYKLLAAPTETREKCSQREVCIDGINILPKPGHALEFKCGHDSFYVLPVAAPHGEYYMRAMVKLKTDGNYDASGDTRGLNVSHFGMIVEKLVPRYFLHGERIEFEYEPKTYNPWLHDSDDDAWDYQMNRLSRDIEKLDAMGVIRKGEFTSGRYRPDEHVIHEAANAESKEIAKAIIQTAMNNAPWFEKQITSAASSAL